MGCLTSQAEPLDTRLTFRCSKVSETNKTYRVNRDKDCKPVTQAELTLQHSSIPNPSLPTPHNYYKIISSKALPVMSFSEDKRGSKRKIRARGCGLEEVKNATTCCSQIHRNVSSSSFFLFSSCTVVCDFLHNAQRYQQSN